MLSIERLCKIAERHVSTRLHQRAKARRANGGPVGSKARLEIINPFRNETNTVELTRQKFTTSNG